MKKIAWLLVLLVVLSACGKASLYTSSSAESSSESVSVSDVSSENPYLSSAVNLVDPAKEYFKTDPSKGEAYNAAITAYNAVLRGTEESFNSGLYGLYDINSFALFDMNGNGVPELLTRSLNGYYIDSYQDGKMADWFSYGTQGDRVSFLENGAMFCEHSSTGISYRYYTFDQNGNKSEVTFFDPDNDVFSYDFNGQEVSKAEWDKLTKKYFDLAKKPASIEWYDYAGNIIQ